MQTTNKTKKQALAATQYNNFLLIRAGKGQKAAYFSMSTTAKHLKKLYNLTK